MKIGETAKVVGHIWAISGWNLSTATVEAWHEHIGRLNFADAERAVRRHFAESTERITPAHVLRAAGKARNPDAWMNGPFQPQDYHVRDAEQRGDLELAAQYRSQIAERDAARKGPI